jgi:hypothetical protein
MTPETKKELAEIAKKWRRDNPVKYLLHSAKARAKRIGVEFSISEMDISIPDVCPVFGIKIVPFAGAFVDSTPSIDRIDTTKGYIPGNVKIISWKANKSKGNMSVPEIEALYNYVKEYSK